MRRILLTLMLLLGWATQAHASEPMPDYLEDLNRPYNSGDWTLQCNTSRLCQIIGAVKAQRSGAGVRAVVMISRGIAEDARPIVRIAFIDALGNLSARSPEPDWRLHSRGLPRARSLQLGLGAAEADGAYRASPEAAARMIGALQRWRGSVIRGPERLSIAMPRGDLARLFRRMDRLQHPRRPRMSAAEEERWLTEYHYVIRRAEPADVSIPEALSLVCDTRTYSSGARGDRIGPGRVLWVVECPEGYKLFVQQDGGEPVSFDVRDTEGLPRNVFYAGFNLDTSMLEVQLSESGDAFCGHRMKFGFSEHDYFVMIEDRRYDRCRVVPHEFWPVVWHPTSWRYVDAPPSNGGNAPPASEGVRTP